LILFGACISSTKHKFAKVQLKPVPLGEAMLSIEDVLNEYTKSDAWREVVWRFAPEKQRKIDKLMIAKIANRSGAVVPMGSITDNKILLRKGRKGLRKVRKGNRSKSFTV